MTVDKNKSSSVQVFSTYFLFLHSYHYKDGNFGRYGGAGWRVDFLLFKEYTKQFHTISQPTAETQKKKGSETFTH